MHHLLHEVHNVILLQFLVNHHNLQDLLLLYHQAEGLPHLREEQVEAEAFPRQWYQRKFIWHKSQYRYLIANMSY